LMYWFWHDRHSDAMINFLKFSPSIHATDFILKIRLYSKTKLIIYFCSWSHQFWHFQGWYEHSRQIYIHIITYMSNWQIVCILTFPRLTSRH
jgi:hypothetical protein